MASVALNPVEGQLPLKADNLPSHQRAATNLEKRVNELSVNTFVDVLLPAYDINCARIRDKTNEIHERNISLSDLRDAKQTARKGQQEMDPNSEIDLATHPKLKELIDRCVKEHGLIAPQKEKLNKDDIRALLDSIEDCCNTHSDMGDRMRLEFKTLSGNGDSLLRLLVELISLFQAMRRAVIDSIGRSH